MVVRSGISDPADGVSRFGRYVVVVVYPPLLPPFFQATCHVEKRIVCRALASLRRALSIISLELKRSGSSRNGAGHPQSHHLRLQEPP